MDGWIILRCSGRSTLRLAASLSEDGFEVWTPTYRERVEIRGRYTGHEVERPLMKGYLFARQPHLIDLLELAVMPVKPRRGVGFRRPAHHDFRVFHYLDRIPLIADRDLNGLRRVARRRTMAPKSAPLKKYQSVRALEGAGSFWGKIGTVLTSNERNTFVCFGAGMLSRVEIPTSFLTADDLNQLQTATGMDRKAA